MLRRRESVEQFEAELGRDGSSSGRASPEYLSAEPPEGLPRPNSALAKLSENAEGEDSYVEDDESGDSSSDIIRRKSMPALRRHKITILDEDDDDSSGSGKQEKVLNSLYLA